MRILVQFYEFQFMCGTTNKHPRLQSEQNTGIGSRGWKTSYMLHMSISGNQLLTVDTHYMLKEENLFQKTSSNTLRQQRGVALMPPIVDSVLGSPQCVQPQVSHQYVQPHVPKKYVQPQVPSAQGVQYGCGRCAHYSNESQVQALANMQSENVAT
ncbi:hypothetical protein L1987_49050 [Smallanthus sonchifolius]|uniref:Uncharacterized protein n=1 Tax=Smallanthus sonchifolius TaxID=185202 RepID=A0ACB9FVA3_9ASTR|nr:hypothetical protein L1987_49050 [Smallanthus sonchifolius]